MKLHVCVERCLIPGIPYISFTALLFCALFFGEFFLYTQIPILCKLPDNLCCIVVLVSSFCFTLLLSYLDEKQHGNTQILYAEIQDDVLFLSQGRRHWQIPLTAIKEVVKVMAYTRLYDEKGKYSMTIKRKKQPSLIFMTTADEYLTHADFEDTELSRLYYALRAQGVKCC